MPFYAWRKRLRGDGACAIRPGGAREECRAEPAAEPSLELVLKTGERLRIGAGVDDASLRTVLAALRA